jgi:transposase
MPAAQAPPGCTRPDDSRRYLTTVDRLDEINGIGRHAAQTIIAEVGLCMEIFPTAAHLVSWAEISARAIQSGTRTRSGTTGNATPYLKSALGEVKPPPRPPAPTHSSTPATAGWSNASANSKPS